MATVSSHQTNPFASPARSINPVDANVVRGNDNILRLALNAHDSDATIHVQSSTLANRPAFGVVDRLWVTTDGTPTLWLDTGAAWVSVGASGGGVSDGDKGDITVSGSGATWTIDNGVVNTAKLGGDITTAGKALLDDADAAAQRTTLGAAAASHTHAASDVVSGTLATARLGSGTANSTTFLRGDQTWAAPTASVAGTTIEVDLGTVWRTTGKFTITDGAISASSKILCWQAPGPYTGKGTSVDQPLLEPVQVVAVSPGSGNATVYWQTPPQQSTAPNPVLSPNFGGGTAANSGTNRDLQFTATRLGKVRGNVKFTYLVLG